MYTLTLPTVAACNAIGILRLYHSQQHKINYKNIPIFQTHQATSTFYYLHRKYPSIHILSRPSHLDSSVTVIAGLTGVTVRGVSA